MDAFISDVGGDLRGYNMFVYCFNNPVMYTDHTGHWPFWNYITEYISIDYWIYSNFVLPFANDISDTIIDIAEDAKNYNPNNQCEEVVFEANYFSNYKGTLVIKTDFSSSFSIGFIGLSKKQQNVKTLKHEYGHKLQLLDKGVGKYIIDVAIPSVTINLLDKCGKLPYDYYSYPWEAEANALGGVAISQSQKPTLPQGGYTSYWDLVCFLNEV